LLWLGREKGVPKYGAPLSKEWESLRSQIKDPLVRSRLSSVMRFFSANNIAPTAVNEAAIAQFIEYRARCGKPADNAFRRLLAKAWNGNVGMIVGWPSIRLSEPAVKSAVDIEWEAFPEGLRRDVERYLEGLNKIRKSRVGQRIKPLKPSTIHTRRAELQAAARMAVKVGVPTEKLNSLSALLTPEVVGKVLDAYWEKNGENPKLYTIDLAGRFLSIAKETKCLDETACEALDELRRKLDAERPEGLTPKNMALIRQVLTPGVWGRVVKLPFAKMDQARRRKEHAPARAAVVAQIAVAIAILTLVPIRIKNLTAMRLGINLSKPGGPKGDYWLHFPDYDVKNRITLEYPLEGYVTKLIDEYVHDFRPALLRGRNEDFLFPGLRRGAKGKVAFSGQITKLVWKHTGLRITAHQFRHAAGALILKKRPGEYELVRQILGHRNVQTTIRCYIGLEQIQAGEIYGQIVKEHLTFDPEDVE
jgi:integrase